ncbi:hypothetical protein M5X06_12830 [Paenibacillus alvei]|uniref:Uncharacterized protein n=1 Tax=Paenibacillus alvei TaxID=44250 RepID=A0ABT4GUN0_PAEAL|nr:hypothetical protein [Paenibacillus alvei]MCY9760405.1 hypothetical protein [Paenibacillus alvei]MCY9767697.1 hypothetical protein [Paenibacillus alvei]
MTTFRGDSDYKTSFERAATCLIDAKIEDRDERMTAVQALIDEYVASIGERPDGAIIEQLTDYILFEELEGDMRTDKINDEYPILSERQMARRFERECGLEIAENLDTEGRNRATPIRRRRTTKESRFVDKLAQMKNRKRSAQYKRDTSPGSVISYNLRDTGGAFADDFVDCRGLGERWANG